MAGSMKQYPTPLVAEVTQNLRTWRPRVRAMVTRAQPERRPALDELTDWFELVSGDDEFDEPAPLAGVDALVDELSHCLEDDHFDELSKARWAVRVAEDLVRVRASASRQVPPATLRIELNRLALTRAGAHHLLDGPSNDPR